jgi:hypothetical protein
MRLTELITFEPMTQIGLLSGVNYNQDNAKTQVDIAKSNSVMKGILREKKKKKKITAVALLLGQCPLSSPNV